MPKELYAFYYQIYSYIEISQDKDIIIEIESQPTGSDQEQLSLIITFQNFSKQTSFQNSLNLEIQDFQLKVKYLEDLKIIVIYFDENNGIPDDQIFSELFQGDQGKYVILGSCIYMEPQNEIQNEINKKYSFYNFPQVKWFNQIIAGIIPQHNYNVNAKEMINKIKKRIIYSQILNHILTNLEQNQLKIYKQIIAENVLGLEEIYIKNKKKLSYKTHFNCFQKITFEIFQENAKIIPIEYIVQPNLMQNKYLGMNQKKIKKICQVNIRYIIKKKFIISRQRVAENQGFKEICAPQFNQNRYYQFDFDIDTKYYFTAYIKIPVNYEQQ